MSRLHRKRISPQFKILIMAFAAIILPSFVLSLVGLSLIAEQEELVEQRLEHIRRAHAFQRIAEFERRLTEAEVELWREVRPALKTQSPQEIHETLTRLAAEKPLVQQVFLLDPDHKPVFPSPPRGTGLPAESVQPWEEESEEAFRWLREGRRQEFLVRNLRLAVRSYGGYLALQRTPIGRARALHLIACCYLKLGEYASAIEQYQTPLDGTAKRHLLNDASVEKQSPSLVILARYHVGTARLRLGLRRSQEAEASRQDGIRTLLTLYGDLVEQRTSLTDEVRLSFFRRQIVRQLDPWMKSRQASPEMGSGSIPALRARYQALRQQAQVQENERRLWEDLHQWIILGLKARGLPTEAEDSEPPFAHLSGEEVGKPSYLVAYAPISTRPEAKPSVLGLMLDLDYLRSRLAHEALSRGRSPGAAFGLALFDERRRVIFGEAKALADYATVVPFGKILRFWRLAVRDRDPTAALSRARQVNLAYAASTALMFAIILCAVYLTVRYTRKQLELSKLKSDFVSNVSHELKTPLALIRMFGETLQLGRARSEGKRQHYYRIITHESERLTQLINNVLDFARIEAGRREYNFEPDDLGEVVQHTLQIYRYDLERGGFTVEVKGEADLPPVLMDRGAITQALLNLFNNAVKYSPGQKYLGIRVRREGDFLAVDVEDHGKGIHKADQAKVFETFYRGAEERATQVKGTGLGLALVQHTMRAHGGDVRLQSVEGEGSTFTLFLPIAGGPTSESSA